jgi:hypothetical protein
LQEPGNNKIIDRIKIGRDEYKVTKFHSNCFGKRDGITAENNNPQQINSCPKDKMVNPCSVFQNQHFHKGKNIARALHLIT